MKIEKNKYHYFKFMEKKNNYVSFADLYNGMGLPKKVKKIPWNKDHVISISWKDKTNFVFSQNDETISIKSIKKSKYIKIITNSSITLNNYSIIK